MTVHRDGRFDAPDHAVTERLLQRTCPTDGRTGLLGGDIKNTGFDDTGTVLPFADEG